VAKPSHPEACLPDSDDLIEMRNIANSELICLDGSDDRFLDLQGRNQQL
jgi:hypothetical protein